MLLESEKTTLLEPPSQRSTSLLERKMLVKEQKRASRKKLIGKNDLQKLLWIAKKKN